MKDGRTIWAWDSQVTSGHSYSHLDFDKVWTNGAYVVGLTGAAGDSQRLRYIDLPELDTWDIDRFMTEKVVKKFDKKMKYYGMTIVELGGRLYEVHPDCWIRNQSGVYAIGSGAEYAMGALRAGASPAEAVMVAAEFDIGTGGTIIQATGDEIRSGELVFDDEKPKKKRKKGKKNG